MIRTIRTAAGALVASDEGPNEHGGAPIVLLHGFTGSKASWRGVRRALRSRRRVIAFDLPGHGASVMDASFDYSLARTADAVIAALDALGIGRIALVGYSMGGRLALQIACRHGSRVERLVLEGASPGIPRRAARAARRRADERLAAAIARDGIAAFVRRWEALPLFASLADLPGPARDALHRARLACAPAGLAASLRGMGSGAQPWLGRRLRALGMPVLLLAGARDGKFTRIARALTTRIPDARLALVRGAGHAPHLEQPERFLDVVGRFVGVHHARRERGAHVDRMDEDSRLRGHHLSARRGHRAHRHQPPRGAERVSPPDRDRAARRVRPRA